MSELIDFYGKYNEEKRLLTPYGRVEFLTTMHYIEKYIDGRHPLDILEVGAATGRYSLALAEKGHNVTAVDLVPYNIGILKQKAERAGITTCKAMVGDALRLKKIPDESQDMVLILGPLYHLFTEEDKVQCLLEAKRVTKIGGLILAGYIMNEFAVITKGFKENGLESEYYSGKLDDDFHVRNTVEDLFTYDRMEDIAFYRNKAGLTEIESISQDGPVNYMRDVFKDMSEETFERFMAYHLATCARPDLIGAGCHTLDIMRRTE